MDNGILHVLDGLIQRHDVGQLEEGSLQYGVGAVAKADALGDGGGIDGVELDITLGNDALCAVGQLGCELFAAPVGIEQEGAALLDFGHDVKNLHVALLVAGHKVSHGDIVGGADGLMAEAQMALGDAAGLLGVVLKVGLSVLVGVVADYLDGVLVCADSTVGAKTPELAGDDALAGGDDVLAHGQGQEGNVVIDADSEVVLHFALHVVVDSLHVGGDGVLGAETIAATQNGDMTEVALAQSGADILEERFTCGAGLLGAVKNGDDFNRLGQSREQMLYGEGAVEMYLNHTHVLAALVEVVHDLVQSLADGAHSHDDVLCVFCAVVVEELVITAGQLTDGLHLLFNYLGQSGVGSVAGLAGLEEGVGILQGGADGGMLGVERMVTEALHSVPVKQLCQILIVQHFDLLQLVGGAEAVKEMHEGDGALDGA